MTEVFVSNVRRAVAELMTAVRARRVPPLLMAAVLGLAAPVSAQPVAGEPAEPAAVEPGIVIDGPPPPVPPAMITREGGQATMRAIRLLAGIRVDGQLDEPVYDAVPPVSDFIQQLPDEGAPATERTEAWVMFDDENFYVAGRCWDSAPPSEWTATEMRRDAFNMLNNDLFGFLIDTFYDRRNALLFYANPAGGFVDQAITNEGNPNRDWNPVWDVKTGRFDGGWTIEMVVPFKSLRYRPDRDQVWGIQIRRTVIRKNEWAYLTLIPISAAGFGGRGGVFRVSAAGTLVGLETPPVSNHLEIKPYAIGGMTTDVNAPPGQGTRHGGLGVDLKYGVTRNLTADFTVNTDFAQVEVDEQQVNLTRFSLFFPEKREFFLEGRGIFDFARGGGPSTRDGALRQIGGGASREEGNAPTLFYSRRIGLQERAVVPIVGGGRVTGKVGAFDVGALNIHAGEELKAEVEPTNFTVVRVKRDLLRRSAVGALVTNRSVSLAGDGASQTYGADGTFSFYDNVSAVAYLARTRTPGLSGRDRSYQGQLTYAGDRYGFQAEHLTVEDNFRPEVGYWRRENFRRSFGTVRFSPRPASIEAIRQFRLEGSFDYVETADTRAVETRQTQLAFLTEFENSDRIGVSAAENYEFLVEPFEPGRDVVLPVGGYRFRDVETTYALGGQRRLSGSLELAPFAHPQLLFDAFGNEYHHVDFIEEIDHVHVALRAEVETEQPVEPDEPSPLMRHLYLSPTVRSPFEPAVTELCEGIPRELDPAATGAALSSLLHGRFGFRVGSTDVGSTALDLLNVGHGVCQDFTHLMLAALRMRDIPARYVSGYLAPHVGEEAAQASHAWVQLLAPDGWHGFDPANHSPQDGRYVVTAVGRDYDDVPPIRGAFTGSAAEHWSTMVRVRAESPEQQ